jgi:hypothetical protein
MHFLFKPLFYIFSLCTGTYLVLLIEKLRPSDIAPHNGLFLKEVVIEPREKYPLRRPSGLLTDSERGYAETAWKYFETHYDDCTGLVAASGNSTSVTVRDMGDYVMALTSARETGVISDSLFDTRMSRFLQFLSSIPLTGENLPYRHYDITTGEPVTQAHCKALDIGRFFALVNKVMYDYPEYLPPLKKALSRWELKNMIIQGALYSIDEQGRKMREGRLGYEEYCSKTLERAGYDLSEASLYTDFLKFVPFNEVKVGVDTREIKDQVLENYITNEPYLLDGLENGWDLSSRELAYRLFLAQKEYYISTRKMITCSEELVDKAPGMVYNTVYSGSRQWNCFDQNGNKAADLRTLSTKIAFAWYALYNDSYATTLIQQVKDLYDPVKGWYNGKFDKTGFPNSLLTLATNSMVLEAMNYRQNGPVVSNFNK